MPDSEVESLILRFRDLVTREGETIRKHRAISAEKGYVWWGWWSKAGECVPDKLFRELSLKSTTSGLRIFLFDSGHKRLFGADCIGIQWSHLHERIPSPEPDHTPEYYKENCYLAWFKFRNIHIEPCAENFLQEYSYVRVDDFFDIPPSRYGPFYNKRIHSSEELRQQDRTIWFIRRLKPEDPVHEVSLLDARKIEPCDFINQYIETTSKNLLWVSDLHYSLDNHGFLLEANEFSKDLGLSIERCFMDHGISDIGGMIVSGDITWRATGEEFNLASSLFIWAQRWGKLHNYQFAISPGNHDIAFSENPADKGSRITVASSKARESYEVFYQNLFYLKPNRFLSSGRRFLLGKAFPVEIACLNSSYLEQIEEAFQGHGFISDDQLDEVANQMGWQQDIENKSKIFRIVILHHHLIPVTFREKAKKGALYSVVLDAEALARWISKYRVRLVLHGHMHQLFCSKLVRPVKFDHYSGDWHEFYIVGMGSTGVKKEHLGEIEKNIFGVLKFERNSVRIEFYSIHQTNPSTHLPEFSLEIPIKE